MAKFKPYKLLESQLDSLPIQEGQFILTTDTKKLYSDTAANTRILISPDAITDLSVNGTTITYTRLDGTTGTITTKDTTYSVASATKNGLMSASDKEKLDTIEEGAQANTITGVKGDSESLYRTGNVNITKANIGLNNVENKSSATIRGELTNSNVTTALGYTPLNSNLKGANNGLAELDASGKVPTAQLPSYVDDVLEYSAKASFPTTGETGKIYVDTSTNKTYRWGGSAYAEISQSIALGTTSSTAFRGDYGQAAYTHAVTNKGSKFDSGLYKIATNAEGHVTGATAVVKSDITALGIPAQDTTYSAATTSAAGLMSSADKTKLDGIAAGAQKNTITGVKGSAETNYRTGNVNITAANIGLGNVENKSSETIRGELTKANVTTALGYTPPTTNTTYEEATTSKAGLMSAAMVTKLNGIEAGAQKNTITGVKGNSESTYRTGNVNITKANIGLGNVDNTADADKEVAHAELASNLDIVATVGSDTASSSGWYKVADSTMSGYGNSTLTLLVKSGYEAQHNGIIHLEMRADSTKITCQSLKWLVRMGFSSTDFRVVVDGMKWTLYVLNGSNQYGRVIFTELQNVGIGGNPTFAINYYNSTTPEATAPTATVTSSDGGSVNYANSAGSATKASQDANGTDIRANYLRKSADYLNTHPENSGTIIPFMNNDIAFLTERGGNAKVYFNDVEQEISTFNLFDASATYWAVNPTNSSITTLVIEITLHKIFTWTNSIYVDHGATGWRAKNVKIETINTNYENDTWVTRYTNTAQSKGNYFTTFTHQAVGSTSGASGFNKIKLTFSDFANATIFRIAQIGVLSYGSNGLRETNMSRGIDDGVYRNITPAYDDKYQLGSSSKKWMAVHTGGLIAYGTAAENPVITRGIAGSDGNGAVGELYLQYGTNSPIKLGNTGAYNISADGSQYSGNAATATNASKVNGLTVQTAVPANAKFTDTTYTGENGVTVSGTKISNSGVRSIATGTSNGTISVNTNGTSANVAVKGLANAAYKGVDTTIGAASTSANLPTSAAVASFVEGKGYKTTDNNTTYTFATGDANGQIKVTPSGGSAQNISVKGLGSLAYKSSLAASDVGALASTLKGAASGVAELDANGKVPSSQLPSYVDDTVEGYLYNSKFYKESAHTTQITGETGKIYVDLSTNKTYRWSGSAFVEISASLALGTTSSTAYRGDYGNTAYTHATDSNRLTTATNSGLYKVASTAQGHIASLTAVTKADITGLGIPGSDTNTTYTFATGDSNGQIKVTPSGGTASNISVKGLAAGAYKGVDTSIAAASTSTNLPTSKAVAAFVEGKGYKTTDNNTTYTLTQDSTDGHKITLTPSSGTATTITIPDDNTTYTFSNGLSASGTTVSNSGVRSIATGTTNGTLSVNTNGTTANVAVKGLAAAAYKGVDTSLASGSTSTNLPTSKAVADLFATLASQVGGMSTVATSLTCTLPDNL